MAQSGGMGNIVLLGGLAVGGYFLYQYLVVGTIPADAVYFGQVPIGSQWKVPQTFQQIDTSNPALGPASGPATTAAAYIYYSPSAKLFYTSFTAPTPAQRTAGSALLQPAPGTTTTQTSSGPVTTPTAKPPVSSGTGGGGSFGGSLDSIYAQLKTLAAADANFTGTGDGLSSSPDHWNYYVNQLLPGASLNLDTLFGGPNRFSPVTAAQFWALAGPVLGKQFGLSGYRGMGLYAGLGAYMQERGVFPHGWA